MFANHAHIMPAALHEDATVDHLLPLLEATGFEGAVCFAPFSHRMQPLGLSHNRWLASQIASHPQLIGYGTLDPTRPPADQVREIVDLGFRGVKFHPAAQKFHVFGDWARSAYEALEEAHLVADFHTGVHWHRMSDYDPLLFDEIAFHYPGLRMVFEHMGGWHFYRQMIAVVVNNHRRGNHLYAGIASVLERDYQPYWYLGEEGIEACRWQMGPDLLIYGLDFPHNTRAHVARDLDTIRNLDWPAEETEKLLGRNLKRLLGIEAGEAAIVGGDPSAA
jgi:uncharacterized protein